MQHTTYTPGDTGPLETTATGVSWPAVWAGAFVATAVSLSLLLLGSALGFAFVSPFSSGPSPVAITAMGAAWLVVMQWISSGFGGYITGRLRTKWSKIHTDEVFFRDTANGFISWSVSTVFVVVISLAVLAPLAHRHGPEMMPPGGPHSGIIDTMLCSETTPAVPVDPATRAEADMLIMDGLHETSFPPEDRASLAQLVIDRTNVPQEVAEKRVDDAVAHAAKNDERMKAKAEKARKAAAMVSLLTFLSLLVGAFIASVSAAMGGRQRDMHY